MNLVATNDMDEIYEDPESTKDDESEDSDDMAASVEAAVKQEEEIVITDAAAVNGGDGDDVNTFAAAIVVEDEAVNAKYVGVEAVKGDIMVKGSKANATAKGQVLKEDERVEGYETREVLGVKMPRRSERHKKISQGLDVKALNYKTHKQRFKGGANASPTVLVLTSSVHLKACIISGDGAFPIFTSPSSGPTGGELKLVKLNLQRAAGGVFLNVGAAIVATKCGFVSNTAPSVGGGVLSLCGAAEISCGAAESSCGAAESSCGAAESSCGAAESSCGAAESSCATSPQQQPSPPPPPLPSLHLPQKHTSLP
ncbi:unnamed protein product [Closterium sp. Naga37s-1]|nr:unnamed protein product [Closterium sp. Naga37s-1]